MSEMQTGVRIRAEGVALIGKPVCTFLVLFYDSRVRSRETQLGLMAFAMGQLTYGILMFGMYLAHYGKVLLWPKRIPSQVSCVFALYHETHQ
jgi:oligosaccharide translocation protein RFT1